MFTKLTYLKVYSTLNKAGISPSEVEGLDRCFSNTNNPFLGIDTRYRQIQFFKSQLGLVVSIFLSLLAVLLVLFIGTCSCITRRAASMEG